MQAPWVSPPNVKRCAAVHVLYPHSHNACAETPAAPKREVKERRRVAHFPPAWERQGPRHVRCGSTKRNRGPHRRRPVPPGTEGRVPGKDEWLLCGPFSAQSTGNHAGDRRPKSAFSEAPWTMEKERQHRLLGERGSMWYSRTPTN
nr:uncharacterized protein LOC119176717 [Rhipicephalus microplus]